MFAFCKHIWSRNNLGSSITFFLKSCTTLYTILLKHTILEFYIHHYIKQKFWLKIGIHVWDICTQHLLIISVILQSTGKGWRGGRAMGSLTLIPLGYTEDLSPLGWGGEAIMAPPSDLGEECTDRRAYWHRRRARHKK